MLLKTEIEMPDYDEKELAVLYLSSIYKRVHKNKFNYIGLTCGNPQAGKSMSTGTIGTMLDEHYFEDLERNTVYDAKQFMDALIRIVKTKQRGRFILWDEAGVGMPARQWYDISNRAISYAIQVAGVFGPIVYFATQDMTYIDSQPRKLINGFFDVSRKGTTYSTMRAYDITVNRKIGKMYWNFPRIETKEGIHVKLKRGIRIYLPPKEFRKRYLEHSKPFKRRITTLSQQRAEDFSSGKISQQELSVSEIIQAVLDDPKVYETVGSAAGRRRLSSLLLEHDFHVPNKMAQMIKLRTEQLMNSKERQEMKEIQGDGPAMKPIKV